MTTVDVGRGARMVTGRPAAGRVVAVYRAAAYLRFPAGLLALTTGSAPPGPLHLRVAVLPTLGPRDAVRTDAATLRGAGWSISLAAPTWAGALPAPERLAAVRSGAAPGPLAARLAAGGLRGLAAAIGGRGPGLTPSGDDVLAGALLVARALRGAAAEPDLVAVAGSVSTTDVAAAFLQWAARGQCIEPAHQWLDAVADGDAVRAARAQARLDGVGASSGRALLSGLRLGLAALPDPGAAVRRGSGAR